MAELIFHPDEKEFDALIAEHPLVLADFWATWCAPCRMVAPIIEQLAQQYDGRVKVVKVDIDEHTELAQRYDVQSIPTILLFKDGKVTARDVGAKPLNNYTEMIDANL